MATNEPPKTEPGPGYEEACKPEATKPTGDAPVAQEPIADVGIIEPVETPKPRSVIKGLLKKFGVKKKKGA